MQLRSLCNFAYLCSLIYLAWSSPQGCSPWACISRVQPYGLRSQPKLAGSASRKHQVNRPVVDRPVLGRPPVLKGEASSASGVTCAANPKASKASTLSTPTPPRRAVSSAKRQSQRLPMAVQLTARVDQRKQPRCSPRQLD